MLIEYSPILDIEGGVNILPKSVNFLHKNGKFFSQWLLLAADIRRPSQTSAKCCNHRAKY